MLMKMVLIILHIVHAMSLYTPALLSVAEKDKLMKEVSIMMSFSHCNVMPLIGLTIDGDMPLLIMPFMTNGSVLEYVKLHKQALYFTNDTGDLEVSYQCSC